MRRWRRSSPTVYPRSRGEHVLLRPGPELMPGLSPLARGTLQHLARLAAIPRFIPAHAGNTSTRSIISSIRAVYPRSRGEHLLQKHMHHEGRGLSPLTRGTLESVQQHSYVTRFIPAHAGNTPLRCWRSTGRTVYPRSRGEHCLSCCVMRLSSGLSPLTRGTPLPWLRIEPHSRFIPAHAGNT